MNQTGAASGFHRINQSLKWLPVRDLIVQWPDAQRELAEYNAKKLAAAFDPDLFGTITVSPLPNGQYHVDDGWTRATAVRLKYGDNEKVPCVVVPATDKVRAAQIFVGMNGGRTKPSAMQMFKAAVTADSPEEVTVEAVTRDLKLRIDNTNAEGSIRAVSALLAIHRQIGDCGLRATLEMIIETWGREAAGFDAQLMRGFAMFLAQPDLTVDTTKLAKRVSRKFTPGRLVGQAKTLREAFQGSLARAVCAILNDHAGRGSAAPPVRKAA